MSLLLAGTILSRLQHLRDCNCGKLANSLPMSYHTVGVRNDVTLRQNNILQLEAPKCQFELWILFSNRAHSLHKWDAFFCHDRYSECCTVQIGCTLFLKRKLLNQIKAFFFVLYTSVSISLLYAIYFKLSPNQFPPLRTLDEILWPVHCKGGHTKTISPFWSNVY